MKHIEASWFVQEGQRTDLQPIELAWNLKRFPVGSVCLAVSLALSMPVQDAKVGVPDIQVMAGHGQQFGCSEGHLGTEMNQSGQ